MILNVIKAEYKDGYKVSLTFNNGETVLTDLEEVLANETRQIFFPLRDIDFFKAFKIKFNTIAWDNEADFAPEFLLELGNRQKLQKKAVA